MPAHDHPLRSRSTQQQHAPPYSPPLKLVASDYTYWERFCSPRYLSRVTQEAAVGRKIRLCLTNQDRPLKNTLSIVTLSALLASCATAPRQSANTSSAQVMQVASTATTVSAGPAGARGGGGGAGAAAGGAGPAGARAGERRF